MVNEEWTNITLTKNGVSVQIDTIQDEEILSKKLTSITPPTSTNNYSVGKKDTKMIDLLQIEERISIDGTLSTDSTSSASTKKAALKTMFKAGGVITVTYESSSITANFEKLSITKSNFDGEEPSTNEIGYKVKFTLLVGVNL